MLKQCLVLLLLLSACDATLPETTDSPVPSPAASASPVASGEKPHDLDTLVATLAGKFGRSWQLVHRTENGQDATQSCYLDDHVVFYTQHRIDFNVGLNACRRGDLVDKSQIGTWQPTSAYDVLIFVGDEPSYLVKILMLTDQDMQLSFIDVDGSEVVETYKYSSDVNSFPTTLGSLPVIAPSPSSGAKATPRPGATPSIPIVLKP